MMKAAKKAHLLNRSCFRARRQLIYRHAANPLMRTEIVVQPSNTKPIIPNTEKFSIHGIRGMGRWWRYTWLLHEMDVPCFGVHWIRTQAVGHRRFEILDFFHQMGIYNLGKEDEKWMKDQF